MVGDVPWSICYYSKEFGLISLDYLYLEFEAQPHNSIPYVHTGLRTFVNDFIFQR